jgi:SMC interacting uncharacterized protein involved in chromosome segregation
MELNYKKFMNNKISNIENEIKLLRKERSDIHKKLGSPEFSREDFVRVDGMISGLQKALNL